MLRIFLQPLFATSELAAAGFLGRYREPTTGA